LYQDQGSDVMLGSLYLNKKNGFPYLSFILILSCLLVSIPTYFNNELYYVFGGSTEPSYIWQYLSFNLEHGSYISETTGYGLTLLVHLFSNLSIILLFGVITENTLGGKRFIVLSLSALVVHIISRFLTHSFGGNGVSGIAYSYLSFFPYIVFLLFKKKRVKMIKSYSIYIISIIFFGICIFGIFFVGRFSGTYHLMAIITGGICTFFWRDYIIRRINYIFMDSDIDKKTPVSFKKVFFIIPLLIICILIFFFTGNLTAHNSQMKILNIAPKPGSITNINQNNRMITIMFSEPVGQILNQRFSSISDNNNYPRVQNETIIDDNEVVMKFSRDFLTDESIIIELNRIFDVNERPYKGRIILEYKGDQ